MESKPSQGTNPGTADNSTENVTGTDENPCSVKPKSLVDQNKIILDFCIDAAAVKVPTTSSSSSNHGHSARAGSLNRLTGKHGQSRKMVNPDVLKAYPILNINSCDKSRQMSDSDDQNTDFLPKAYKYVSIEPSMSSVSSTLEPDSVPQTQQPQPSMQNSFKKKSISTNLATAIAISNPPVTSASTSKKSKNQPERTSASNENSKTVNSDSKSKESCKESKESKESKSKTEPDLRKELKEAKSVEGKKDKEKETKDGKASQEQASSRATTKSDSKASSTKSKSNSKKHSKAGGTKGGKSNQSKGSKNKGGSGGTSVNTKSKKKHSK